jgi:GNAT superfamily N-acetyltransferase
MTDLITNGRAVIRDGSRPGDVGEVVRLHGVLYAREEGMDATVEAYIARTLGELTMARARDGDRAGRLWVAEIPASDPGRDEPGADQVEGDPGGGSDARLVGSIGIVRVTPETAQLRWFLVDPLARGQGLGRRLLERALGEARRCGYRSMFLWTIAGLAPAHRLYRDAGFVLTDSRGPQRQWGRTVTEQRFDLDLTR